MQTAKLKTIIWTAKVNQNFEEHVPLIKNTPLEVSVRQQCHSLTVNVMLNIVEKI